jgi:hypothetical protein
VLFYSLTEAGLVGTKLIPSTFKPTVSVAAKFPKGLSVDLGNTIAINESQEAPSVQVVRCSRSRVAWGSSRR